MNAHVSTVRGPASALDATGLLTAFRAWRDRRREIGRITRELECYSDRELAELGLCRGDIADVARGTYKRF